MQDLGLRVLHEVPGNTSQRNIIYILGCAPARGVVVLLVPYAG